MPESGEGVGTVERILSLKRLPMLGSLPAAQLAVVADQTRERFFPKGAALLREGEPIPAIFIVLDGKVHVARGGRLLGHPSPGSAVGGLGVLAGESQGISAVAETDTLALELDVDTMLEIFEDNFPILLHVLRQTCRDLVGLLVRAPAELVNAPQLFADVTLPPRELDLVERILFLRRGTPFERSSINALAELSRGMTEVHYDPGAVLFEEGDPSGPVLLVVSGSVACSGRRGELSFRIGPGMPVGAADSVAEMPRWYTAVTETKVVALVGHVEGLIDVFEDNFEMAMGYLGAVARWALAVLERTAGQDEESLERFFGCEEAPDDPT